MRLALARLPDDEVQRGLDLPPRRCSTAGARPQVLAEVFARVRGARPAAPAAAPVPAGPVPRLRRAGSAGQDAGEAEEYWRGALAGLRPPDPAARATGRPAARTAPGPAPSGSRVRAGGGTPTRLRERRPAHRADPQHGGAGRLGAAAVPLQRRGGRRASAPPSPAARPSCRASSRWSACSSTRCRSGSGSTRPAPCCRWLRRAPGRAQAEARRFEYVLAGPGAGAGATCRRGAGLFDSIVVFENYPVDEAAAAAHGLAHAPESRAVEHDQLPAERGRRPRRPAAPCDLGYDPAPVRRARPCERLAAAPAQRCSAASPRDPDRRLRELPLLPERGTRAGSLVEWNGHRACRCAARAALPELFAAQAARAPRTPPAVVVRRRPR